MVGPAITVDASNTRIPCNALFSFAIFRVQSLIFINSGSQLTITRRAFRQVRFVHIGQSKCIPPMTPLSYALVVRRYHLYVLTSLISILF